MPNLYIYHHLGLGDMIHCNGMVRYFLREDVERVGRLGSFNFDKIYVFTKNCHRKSVDWMYRDEDRIETISIDETRDERAQINAIIWENKTKDDEYLIVGQEFYKENRNEIGPMPVDMLFYDQIDVPYSVRFDDCYWERDENEEDRVFDKLVNSKEYIFVHDDPSRGFEIDQNKINKDFQIIKNDMSELIFNLGKVITNAKEVHLMESSIRCMIENFKDEIVSNGVKLYLHYFRGGPYLNKELNKWNGTNLPWNIVEY